MKTKIITTAVVTLFIAGMLGIAATIIPLPATIDINPDTLNLKSNGEWISCYVELPEGYDANDIDVSTILLNGTIPVDSQAPARIGDHDEDFIPDLMVKFSRAEVLELTRNAGLPSEKFSQVTLEVTGELAEGTPFKGSDTIRVISIRTGPHFLVPD